MLKLSKIWKMIVLMLILSLFVGGSTYAQDTDIQRPFTVTNAYPARIDPALGMGNCASNIIVNLYDPLIFPGLRGEEVQPHVAESWEVSADGLTWTFYLRPSIKFHNGSELDAEDVKFTMDRMLVLGTGYSYLFTMINETKVVDKYTVSFHLDQPFGPLLGALARFWIVNKDLVLENITEGAHGDFGDYGSQFLSSNAAGSGPYKIKEFNYQTGVTLEQNPDYWIPLDPNSPDEWRSMGTTEPIVAKTQMPKRNIEVMGVPLPNEVLAELDKVEGIDLGFQDSGDVMYGMLNTKKAPTDCVYVRRALAWATNYELIVEQIFPGTNYSIGPVHRALEGFDPTVFQYHYDLDKAREELKKSKYYGEFDKYPISIHWTAEVSEMEKVAFMWRADLASIGLTVDIVKTLWQKVVEECGSLETSPNMTTVSVSPGYGEAGALLASKYHSDTTRSWMQNEWLLDPELDRRIEDAIATVDKDERFEKYRELQHYIVDLCPSLFLFERRDRFPYQSYYMDWPMETEKDYPVVGYNFSGRFIKIYPEKRLELLK